MNDLAYEKKVINERLKWAIDNFPFKKIEFAVADRQALDSGTTQAWPRIGLILEGTREMTLPLKNGVKRLQLVAGDAYYALPNAWEASSLTSSMKLLCVVPRINYTRVAYYDKPYEMQTLPVPFLHHTSQPYSESMRFTVEALNALPWLDNQDAGPDLARAMLRLALRECLVDIPAHGGKGKATFDRVRCWLENCFQEDIDRDGAAAQFGLTPSYLSRLFQAMTGRGFHQYLMKIR